MFEVDVHVTFLICKLNSEHWQMFLLLSVCVCTNVSPTLRPPRRSAAYSPNSPPFASNSFTWQICTLWVPSSYDFAHNVFLTLHVESWTQLNFGQHAFLYGAPAAWNCLPPTLQQMSNTDSFKRHLKHFSTSKLTLTSFLYLVQLISWSTRWVLFWFYCSFSSLLTAGHFYVSGFIDWLIDWLIAISLVVWLAHTPS